MTGYGVNGPEDAKRMAEALKAHSLTVSYNGKTKKFTIHDSAGLNKEEIEKIFKEKVYSKWRPCLLDETDEWGNRLVELRSARSSVFFQKQDSDGRRSFGCQCNSSSNSLGGGEGSAQELISLMKRRLCISFSGKTCLDVGCGKGENAIAMAREGAEVIGIDPDFYQLVAARENGMAGDHLVEATLQEYCRQFPNHQFDMVTVFLWNIPLRQKEEVMAALTQVVKKEGVVVISYHDQSYHTDPLYNLPSLAPKFFTKVQEFETSGRNRHILKCSEPKVSSEKEE